MFRTLKDFTLSEITKEVCKFLTVFFPLKTFWHSNFLGNFRNLRKCVTLPPFFPQVKSPSMWVYSPLRRISSHGCYANNCFFLPVPLGSIPELPAETCHEIKSSEGGQAVSGKYWFHSIVPESSFLAPCDMKTDGEFNCLSILLQTKNGLPQTKALTEMLWVDCDPLAPPLPKTHIDNYSIPTVKTTLWWQNLTNRGGEILLPVGVVESKFRLLVRQ